MTICLAGGCFWGVEEVFREMKGVLSTSVGYANSSKENPTYKQVCSGVVGAAEAIKITYDQKIVTLAKILDVYFGFIDPLAVNRQGNDSGTQYRTGIYYEDQADLQTIQNKLNEEQENYPGQKLAVECSKLQNYFLAEDNHQQYLKKNPNGYCHINMSQHKQ